MRGEWKVSVVIFEMFSRRDAGSLSYVNPASGNYRLVKVLDGVFIPPKSGWRDTDGSERLYWVSKHASIPNTPPEPSISKCATSTPAEQSKTELKMHKGTIWLYCSNACLQ